MMQMVRVRGRYQEKKSGSYDATGVADKKKEASSSFRWRSATPLAKHMLNHPA